jgi:hypothetical protein
MVRKNIEQRGDEHVARHAANGIEVKLHLSSCSHSASTPLQPMRQVSVP